MVCSIQISSSKKTIKSSKKGFFIKKIYEDEILLVKNYKDEIKVEVKYKGKFKVQLQVRGYIEDYPEEKSFTLNKRTDKIFIDLEDGTKIEISFIKINKKHSY